MTDKIALAGTVGNDPIHTINSQGLVITKFRLVTHERRFDEKQQVWIDKQTNWYQVSTFRELAAHVAASVVKGQDVIVLGKLSLSDWNNGTKSGTNVAVEADAVGHNLRRGTANWMRIGSASGGRRGAPGLADDSAIPAEWATPMLGGAAGRRQDAPGDEGDEADDDEAVGEDSEEADVSVPF